MHKSSFDLLKKGKLEKEMARKCGRKRKQWKVHASKKRGIDHMLKMDRERRQERKEIRNRKVSEKMARGEQDISQNNL